MAILIHELGHVLAAWLVGFRVFSLELGRDRLLVKFLWLGFRWRFLTVIFNGRTRASPRSAPWFRLKHFLFVLGGPLANALAMVLAVKFRILDQLFGGTAFERFAPVLGFALGKSHHDGRQSPAVQDNFPGPQPIQ